MMRNSRIPNEIYKVIEVGKWHVIAFYRHEDE